MSLRPARLDIMLQEGRRGASALQRLRKDPERFLATVQVGITVVGATAAAFGGASFAAEVVPWFQRVPWLAAHAEQAALISVVAVISYLSLVIGELCPKSLALRHAERYALLIAPPLLGLGRLARPLVWFLTASSNLVLRPLRDSTSFTESRLTLAEVRRMVEDAAAAGSVHEAAGEIASRALEFSTLTVEDVMVHRRFVAGLARDASPEEVRRVILEVGHRRIPIYQDSIDQIVGYISWRDVVERVWAGRSFTIEELVRPCTFVPETAPAIQLLREMQSQRQHLAIAVDEHGGTAGIVTLEDLVEELVGEIFSEHDPAPQALLRRDGDGSWLIQGGAQLRDVNRELEIALPGEDEVSTVAGLCLLLHDGSVPPVGQKLVLRNLGEIEVLETSARRVRKVRLRLTNSPALR